MAVFPIDVIDFSEKYSADLQEAAEIANKTQNEFRFDIVSSEKYVPFSMFKNNKINGERVIELFNERKKAWKGFHPYTIFVFDEPLQYKNWVNLFTADSEHGDLTIITTDSVESIIGKNSGLTSYFIYFFCLTLFKKTSAKGRGHKDGRDCIFDFKIEKDQIIDELMRPAICEDCQEDLLNENSQLSDDQFSALRTLLETGGRELRKNQDYTRKEKHDNKKIKPKIFIGSSSESLGVAQAIQTNLEKDCDVDVWNQGTIFIAGEVAISSLINAVHVYDFAVFVFAPDDTAVIRDNNKTVPRDNVIFEAGLFAGILGHEKTFIFKHCGENVQIPSDLNGVTTLSFGRRRDNARADTINGCTQIIQAMKGMGAFDPPKDTR